MTTAKSKNKTKPKNSKKSNTSQIVVGLIVLALLTVVAVCVYRMTQAPRSVAEVRLAILGDINNTYSGVFIDDSGWFAETSTGVKLKDPAFEYSVNSRNLSSLYFTLGDIGSTESVPHYIFFKRQIHAATSMEQISAVVSSVMKRAGYSRIDIPHGHSYQKGDINCDYTEENGLGSFNCYDPETIFTAATEAEPFVKSYAKANSAKLSDITFGPLVIKGQFGGGVIGSSHAAGYDIAEAVVADGDKKWVVLYYNKNDGPWQYIAKATDEFGFRCGDFMANKDVRKAMYDQICLGRKGHVRLDTQNRALQ